jgi:hypothetical protein
MPYENIVALVLLILVLLAPFLKWAKDWWMTDCIPIGGLDIPANELDTPEQLEQWLMHDECIKFIPFFYENQIDFGRELGRRSSLFEEHFRKLVNVYVDKIWNYIDDLEKSSGECLTQVKDIEQLLSDWGGFMTMSQQAALWAELDKVLAMKGLSRSSAAIQR